MKAAFSDIKKYSREFQKHWLQYLSLFILLDLLNQFIVIPLFRYVTTFVLQAGAIPFISYQNVITIITSNTLDFGLLIVELIVLIMAVYIEFSFLLLGIHSIKESHFNFRNVWKQTFRSLTHMRLGSILLLTVYFILIVPFVDIVYRTPLLAKIQIPQFIMDYMTRSIWLLVGLIAFFVIATILGLRWVITLPLMTYQKMKTRAAMKKSWHMTGHKEWWQLIKRLVLIGIVSILALAIGYGVIYLCQMAWDLLPKSIAFIGASINMLLIQVVAEFVAVWAGVVSLLIVTQPVKMPKFSDNGKKHNLKFFYVLTGILAVIAIGDAAVNNNFYLKGINLKKPLIISHRGVNNHNGVQNSIAALKKTAKLKPDLVEIDLHETKDNQFVVLHDENLEKLAGVNKKPKELTLKQLTKLILKEDGHTAKLASFDQYLKAAQKLNQKLLIEIKTTPQDSKKMLNNFNKKYAKTILKNKYQVQSLDYRVVSGLHDINPKLFVLYIQPYNFTYPHSVADGYSMEYSTLNNDFIWQAHLQNHPVYAWTVNTEDIMKRMMFIHADGLITDDVKLAKKTIRDFESRQNYAERLKNYLLIFPTSTNYDS